MPSSTPPKTASLAEALVAFQAEMPTVPKDETAVVPTKSGGQYSYKYADLASVVRAATPLLVKHGLSFTCEPRHVMNGAYEMVGVLRHGEEQIEGALPLFGRTMPEIGSSITYARRYLLGCLTGLVTDEDTDGPGEAERTTYQPDERMEPTRGASEDVDARTAQERDRAFRRWQASVPDGTREQFMGAIEATTGRRFNDLRAADFSGFWKGMEGVVQ